VLRGNLFLLGALLLNPGQAQTHFPLPKSAEIMIGQPQWKPGDSDADLCRNYRITPQQLRRQFRTYHLLQPGDVHDQYSVFQCWIDGTIKVNGKTFRWQSRPGNLLQTNWPDGVDKMLGGKPSGELKD
jgi:hypothetical protein